MPFPYYIYTIFRNNNQPRPGLHQEFVYILITRLGRFITTRQVPTPTQHISVSTYLCVENMTKAKGLEVRMVSPCLYCFTADIVMCGGWWWRWWRESYHGRDTLNTEACSELTIPGLEAAQVYRVRGLLTCTQHSSQTLVIKYNTFWHHGTDLMPLTQSK